MIFKILFTSKEKSTVFSLFNVIISSKQNCSYNILTRRTLSVLFLPTPRSSCLNASNETLLELRSSSLRDLFFNKAFPISWQPSIPKPFQATFIDSRVSLFYNKNHMLYWVCYSTLFPYKRTRSTRIRQIHITNGHSFTRSLTIETSAHRPIHVQNLSEWLLFNANSTIFQLYQGEYRLNFNGMMTRPALYQTNTLSWICYSASSLKQQSADRHVASLGQILPIPSQPVFGFFS